MALEEQDLNLFFFSYLNINTTSGTSLSDLRSNLIMCFMSINKNINKLSILLGGTIHINQEICAQ